LRAILPIGTVTDIPVPLTCDDQGMPAKNPAAPTDSDLPKPPLGARVVALRTVVGWVAVLVLGAGMGVAIVSTSTVATAVGVVLGMLLAALVATATVVLSGRRWPLFPALLITCLYIASAAETSGGYLAAHGARYTATAVSAECHRVKYSTECTARLRRPDGTTLAGAVPVAHRMQPGDTVDLVEDPLGVVAPHPADELDPDMLPTGAAVLGAAACLLAGLVALAAWLGIRHPKPKSRPGRANRGPHRPAP